MAVVAELAGCEGNQPPFDRTGILVHLCELDAPELIALLCPRCPRFFLAPLAYDRFNAVDICAFLGSSAALEALLELAGSESEEVLTAVDDAVCAVISTINAVYGDLLAIAENSGG